MSEYEETVLLANKILDRPSADPDDDEAMLARQFLRQTEIVQRLKADLAEQHDPHVDLVNANRDEILRKHQEAVRLIRVRLEKALTDEKAWSVGIDNALAILDALSMFHPMHAESWKGWPE